MVGILTKERHVEHKNVIENHIYSNNRNKIQMNLIKLDT